MVYRGRHQFQLSVRRCTQSAEVDAVDRVGMGPSVVPGTSSPGEAIHHSRGSVRALVDGVGGKETGSCTSVKGIAIGGKISGEAKRCPGLNPKYRKLYMCRPRQHH